jgi:hypothetical protein
VLLAVLLASLLAWLRGLAVDDGAALDDPESWPPDGSSAWRALVQPANAAPTVAEPRSRKKSRRSIGTRTHYLAYGGPGSRLRSRSVAG